MYELIVVGTAFQLQSRKNPNYGKAAGMKASEWWANVSTYTFRIRSGCNQFIVHFAYWMCQSSSKTVLAAHRIIKPKCVREELQYWLILWSLTAFLFFSRAEPIYRSCSLMYNHSINASPALPPSKVFGGDVMHRLGANILLEAILPCQFGIHLTWLWKDLTVIDHQFYVFTTPSKFYGTASRSSARPVRKILFLRRL